MTAHTVAHGHAAGPRTLVVWCPDWGAFAARTAGRLPLEGAAALTAKGLISAVSPEARALGVKPGLRIREAQLRAPDITLAPHDVDVDAREFEPVIAALEERIPGVEALEPGCCAVRSRGPARYYGSETEAARVALAAVFPLVPSVRAGIADTVFAAEQAVRLPRSRDAQTPLDEPLTVIPPGQSAAFLAGLPTRVLGDSELVSLLDRLGIRTLGAFAALPSADVERRFGAAGAVLHARAAGRDPRRVQPRIPPKNFDRVVEFDPALEQTDQVAFGCRMPADELVHALAESGLVATEIRITITGERARLSEREWGHPRYFTPADVVDRVRWQLEGEKPGTGGLDTAVERVHIAPAAVDALCDHEDGLWGGGPDDRVHHAMSRVQSLLGHRGVLTATAGGGRLLSERRVLVPWGEAPPVRAHPGAPWPGRMPDPQPATVFEHAQPVSLVDAAGDPARCDERGAFLATPVWFAPDPRAPKRRVTAWAGPWPLVQRWWDADRALRSERVQLVDETGTAWLLLSHAGSWWAEAQYD